MAGREMAQRCGKASWYTSASSARSCTSCSVAASKAPKARDWSSAVDAGSSAVPAGGQFSKVSMLCGASCFPATNAYNEKSISHLMTTCRGPADNSYEALRVLPEELSPGAAPRVAMSFW